MKNRIEILREYIDSIILNMSNDFDRRCAYVHLYGVSQACTLIALKRGENAELLTMAGMLHDFYTYKFGYTKDHDKKGAILAREVFEKLKITTDDETDLICSAISNHSSKGITHSSFDEVLVDADVLQHCIYNVTMPILEHEKIRFEKLVKEFGLIVS
ncbi:MAG: HD domain-containing protein [Defluviitaleaceae bacterium]|nr:HD domain-containing protein [Defluviitaleaceae bacterium]